MNIDNIEQQKAVLKDNINILNKAKATLQYSLNKCQMSTVVMSNDELESCEALTARFARAVDILTQKVFMSVFLILAENPLTFVDKCNLAEKLGIIQNAGEVITMRKLRNEIAHEYRNEDLIGLFALIQKNAVVLCKVIDVVNCYVEKNNIG